MDELNSKKDANPCFFEFAGYDVGLFIPQNWNTDIFMIKPVVFTALGLFLVSSIAPAFASEPKLLARFGDWEAHAFEENGSKVCFMASQPQKKQGNYSRRGEPFALVTHRPADNTRDVFSYITGYTYKAGSTVTVTIDDQEFKLVTQDETAWGPDADTDKKLSRAIRDGSKMVIKGVSSRGTNTTDTLSLSGTSKAYERMSQECGY